MKDEAPTPFAGFSFTHGVLFIGRREAAFAYEDPDGIRLQL